jgi:hypothetical protein
MSAKITVQRGENSGEQHWIEDEVSRIGSGPDCTFVIHGIPPHCLTVLYRAGQYSIVNRCRQAIDVDGEPLLPMATASIRGGGCVAIGTNTVLRLDVEGDPAPSRRRRSVIDSAAVEQHDLGEEIKPTAKQTVMRYAALAAALLAGCYLLLGDSSAGGNNDMETSQEFREVVDILQPNPAAKDDGPGCICRALQRARIEELRGQSEQAIADYEIAKKLVSENPQKPGWPARSLRDDVCERTRSLVMNRLKALK